jgi:alkylation response protein AidB-like acyl-CoA dehydrogenase
MYRTKTLTGPGGLADQLGPSIKAAADSGAYGEIPAALIAELRDAGAFGLFTPQELGGSETTLPIALEVYDELARLDASVAWLVWNANFGFIAALLGQEGIRLIWPQRRPDPIFATGVPEGRAVPADRGYQVSGTWPLVSGLHTADWVLVVATITASGGEPRRTEAGRPDVRLFAVPRARVTVKDSGPVTGLRGAVQGDLLLENVTVPEALTAPLTVPAVIDRPLYRGFIPGLVLPGSAMIGLGAAAAAVDEVAGLAAAADDGRPARSDSPYAQVTIAQSEADLKAARLLLYSAAWALQTAGEAATAVTAQQRADLRAAMSHAALVGRRVLTAMYELGGATTLRPGSRLERQFRDGMAALQHADLSGEAFTAAGRVRLGLPPGMLHF